MNWFGKVFMFIAALYCTLVLTTCISAVGYQSKYLSWLDIKYRLDCEFMGMKSIDSYGGWTDYKYGIGAPRNIRFGKLPDEHVFKCNDDKIYSIYDPETKGK